MNLDVDVHNAEKLNQKKQMAMAAEIAAAANNGSEFDEDNLQDDIPIDDDYDDEDGIISDNYENYTDNKKAKERRSADREVIEQPQEQVSVAQAMNSALDENVISMDHSDDLEASPQMRVALQKAQEEQDLQALNQKKLKQPPAVGTRQINNR